jgi:hypothetical protein
MSVLRDFGKDIFCIEGSDTCLLKENTLRQKISIAPAVFAGCDGWLLRWVSSRPQGQIFLLAATFAWALLGGLIVSGWAVASQLVAYVE